MAECEGTRKAERGHGAGLWKEKWARRYFDSQPPSEKEGTEGGAKRGELGLYKQNPEGKKRRKRKRSPFRQNEKVRRV